MVDAAGAGRRGARAGARPAAATSRSSRQPTTPRTRPGWRTSPSSSRSPASSPTSRCSAPRPTRPTDPGHAGLARLPGAGRAGGRLRPDPRRRAEDGGVVTLMTLHTAKGLEFPVVFLTGLEDGVFPHMRSLGDQPELEEERRLAYVGVTRAQQRLYVSRAVVRSAWGAPSHNPASRFLDELPVDLVDWRRTEAAQTSWNRPVLPSLPQRNGRPADPPVRHRRGPGRRRGQGQKREVPVPGAGRPRGARLVRHGQRGHARGSRRQGRRVDRLRVPGRQAAAAALRPGREALSGRAAGSGRRPCASRGVDGSTGSPAPGRTSRCRCGPVVLPVEPTVPIGCPPDTLVPTVTDDAGLVAVPDLGAVLELDDRLVAVGAVVADLGHDSAGDGVDRGAARRGEVQAGVTARPQRGALAESRGQAVGAGRDRMRPGGGGDARRRASRRSQRGRRAPCCAPWPVTRPRPAARRPRRPARSSRAESRLTARARPLRASLDPDRLAALSTLAWLANFSKSAATGTAGVLADRGAGAGEHQGGHADQRGSGGDDPEELLATAGVVPDGVRLGPGVGRRLEPRLRLARRLCGVSHPAGRLDRLAPPGGLTGVSMAPEPARTVCRAGERRSAR